MESNRYLITFICCDHWDVIFLIVTALFVRGIAFLVVPVVID